MTGGGAARKIATACGNRMPRSGRGHVAWGMSDFRRLTVWQRAHQAALETHRATMAFSVGHSAWLAVRMRRVAASVAASIAESCGGGTPRDEARCLQVAAGSARELQYFALLAHDLGLLPEDLQSRVEELAVETQRMLGALLRRVPRPHR